MRISVLCHYFWPELGAPSARLREMAETWVAAGHDVTVVTNFPNHPTGVIHPGYEGRSFMEERVAGMRILRCKTYATPNNGILRKTLGHLVFMVNAVRQAGRRLAGTDVIVVSSPTLFSAVSAWWLSRRLRRPYIIEVRDLWPAIFVELGVLRNRLAIRILESLELFLYRQSAHVVTVTQAFADDIVRRGQPREKVSVIPNGVDLKVFVPGEKSASLAEEFGVAGKFTVLYIGALGISHGLGALLEAARLLSDDPDIRFLIVGEGAEREKLTAQAETLGLKNLAFFPGQPRARVRDLYWLADVCVVPLRNIPLFRTFIPSKMFEIMGAARPILAALEGEAAEILRRSGAAVIVPPENAEEIARAARELKSDPLRRAALGAAGRDFARREYDRVALAGLYLDVMKRVAGSA